jgi:hypothetical protein
VFYPIQIQQDPQCFPKTSAFGTGCRVSRIQIYPLAEITKIAYYYKEAA